MKLCLPMALQGGTSYFDDEWMMYANQIVKYMGEQEDDKPFFAYLAFTAPHDPLHVPDEWLATEPGTDR